MGLLSTLFSRRPATILAKGPRRNESHRNGPRRNQVEPLEERRLMAGDVLLGSVYFEEATGDDSQPDVIQVSFVGGAEGTTLDRLVIDGDRRLLEEGQLVGDGRNGADPFFDIEPGGPGSFDAVGLSLISTDGFTVTDVTVEDGGTAIVFEFEGFDAGEELVFSVDVDETSSVLGQITGSTPVVEGAEFERSVLTGDFSAPGFVDLNLQANFFDAFDENFAAAESAAAATLDALPDDSFDTASTPSLVDRTAGAVAHAPQQELATLSGYAYHDRDDDGLREAGEEGISGVTLELLDENGAGTGVFTTTNDNGFYQFTDLFAGTYGVRETQPDDFLDGQDSVGNFGGQVSNDLLTGVTLDFGDDGVEYNFGELLAGSISGRVHASPDGDCDFDNPGELLEGVTIELLSPDGQVLRTTTTDSQGRYTFAGLRPGEYQVREIQPEGFFDGAERAGTTGGTVESQPQIIESVVLIDGSVPFPADFNLDDARIILNADGEGLETGVSYTYFATFVNSATGEESRPSNAAGPLPVSNPGAGIELDLEGLARSSGGFDSIRLYRNPGANPSIFREVATLPLGTISYFDTASSASISNNRILDLDGSVSGPGSRLVDILTRSGSGVSASYSAPFLPGTLSFSAERNGFSLPSSDLTVTEETTVQDLINFVEEAVGLIGTDGGVSIRDGRLVVESEIGEENAITIPLTAFQTLADGSSVPSVAILFFGTGQQAVDRNDLISGIQLGSGVDSVNNDFCEHVGASLSGFVYHDVSNDGIRDAGEEPIAGVTLRLLDGEGNPTGRTAVTDANGFYQFTGLEAGTYQVLEEQPAGFLDGLDTPGTPAGGVAENPGDLIREITLDFGDQAVEYNFGELLAGSISGRVHASPDGDCDFDNPGELLEGVTIQLLDADGNVLRTTQTDALGEYRFDSLPPGEYQIREIQPEGYFDGSERAGTAGGTLSDDLVSGIRLGSGVDAVNYDFCEHVGAELSGFVYHDRDNDGLREAGEEGIAGVTVTLLNGDGTATGLTAVTLADGSYWFTGLTAGAYRVVEVQPDGFLDGLDTPGTPGGGVADNPGDEIRDIVLDFGDRGVEYNFGELLPGSIAGRVTVSPEGDCEDHDSGDPIEGVTIELYNADGLLLQTTTTDASGEYLFEGLRPGSYTVREIQPGEYFDGSEHLGSVGGQLGDDTIAAIEIGSGVAATDYDFCEHAPAGLSGYVFIDGPPIVTPDGQPPEDIRAVRDGLRTPDDQPLAGVTVRLVNGITGLPFYALQPGETIDDVPDGFVGIDVLPGAGANVSFETTTDANGYYEFLGLPSGSFGVVQVQPAGVFDSLDTPGTTGGDAVNVARPGDPDRVFPLHQIDPNNDFVFRIQLAAGDFSQENNFSEISTQFTVFPPPPPVDDPPPFVPPTPITPGSFLPPPPLPIPARPAEEFIGGSEDVYGFAWHLSVINAGAPRELGPQQRTAQFASQSTNPAWDGAQRDSAELRQAKWHLLASDIDGAELNELLFGSEDAVPVAGDWDGDGVTDIGVFIAGDWYLDLDGDGRWGPGDLWAHLGTRDDLPVTGDWDGDGKTDIGIYGPAWPRDPHAIAREPGIPDVANRPGPIAGKAKNVPPTEEDATSGARLLAKLRATIQGRRTDRIDHVFHYGTPGDAPVAGDWNGDGVRTVGVFRDGYWTLDTTGDGRVDDDDLKVALGRSGDRPIVGDWDGDGRDDLGVYRDGQWLVDPDRDGTLEELRIAATDQALALGSPVVGDWDGDGRDEPAVFTPGGEPAEVRVSSAPSETTTR